MKCLICGSGKWSDRDTMERALLKLPKSAQLRLCGSGVVNEMALALADELGLDAQVQPGWDRRMEPQSRAATLYNEVRPDIVLAFTDELFENGHTTGTFAMVNRGVVNGHRVTIVPSRRM